MSYLFYLIFMPVVAGIFPVVCGLVYLLSVVFGFAFTYKLSFMVWGGLILTVILLLNIRHRILKRKLVYDFQAVSKDDDHAT